ncbi:MAG: hypothetical protein HN432_10805, partial [Gammaproteobacteria bacterium]|nr:hypothetical protein [Gammaproteobacteria bacterium]
MKTGLKRLAAYLFAGNLATLRSLLVPMLTLILVCSCAVNPVTGKNELSLVSEQSEIRIGSKQYLPTQQSQGGLYTVDK